LARRGKCILLLAGKLVPDAIVTAMVKSRLSEPDAQKGFILDGYPRTIRQALDLEEFQVREPIA
jgi:adenylate kinase